MADAKDNKFYVYEHWRSDKDLPFYVGKGHGPRAADMLNGRNDGHKVVQQELASISAQIKIKMVAELVDEKSAFLLERQRISFWREMGVPLVNLTIGGEGCSGYKHTPEEIAKCVAFHTGRKRSPETRERIAAKARGRPANLAVIAMLAALNRGKKRIFTDEHKAKIGEASKGRKMPPHVKAALLAANTGRSFRHTENARAKMSAARTGQKGPPISAEHKAAISAANRGRTFSPESRIRMSEAAKLHWSKKANR